MLFHELIFCGLLTIIRIQNVLWLILNVPESSRLEKQNTYSFSQLQFALDIHKHSALDMCLLKAR